MQNDFLKNILQKNEILIDEVNILELSAGFHLRKIAKDAFFIREGDISHEIAIVKSGIFCSYHIENSGLEAIKYFHPEETILLSYYAYLTGQESAYYIQALEESEIYVMELSDFKQIVKGNYQLLYLCKKVLDEILVMKEEHATSFTRFNNTERYKQFQNTYPSLEMRVKQYQIASYLGITPVSLSRIRRKLDINKR